MFVLGFCMICFLLFLLVDFSIVLGSCSDRQQVRLWVHPMLAMALSFYIFVGVTILFDVFNSCVLLVYRFVVFQFSHSFRVYVVCVCVFTSGGSTLSGKSSTEPDVENFNILGTYVDVLVRCVLVVRNLWCVCLASWERVLCGKSRARCRNIG